MKMVGTQEKYEYERGVIAPVQQSWVEEEMDASHERAAARTAKRADEEEALYGVGDFQHVHFNKRVGLLLERLFPGEVHRRTLKVDRIKGRDALPITGTHVKLMTGLINRMAFKDALTYQSAGLKVYKTTHVSQQIRKYTYRRRKAYEFSQLPDLERDRIKKTRQDKAKRLKQGRRAARRFAEGDPQI